MTKGNIVKPKTEYDKTSEWKNWLVFINNTHNKLNELEEIGAQAYFDKKYLNLFFAKLNMFITPRMSYIDEPVKLRKYLDNIGSEIFKSEYIKDLNKGTTSSKMQEFQYKTMRKLNNAFRIICNDFSSYELIPKVKKTKIIRQKESMKGVSL